MNSIRYRKPQERIVLSSLPSGRTSNGIVSSPSHQSGEYRYTVSCPNVVIIRISVSYPSIFTPPPHCSQIMGTKCILYFIRLIFYITTTEFHRCNTVRSFKYPVSRRPRYRIILMCIS